ncbi:MAG TPA: DinB family protein [Thermomicrobiales bacterium]|nr:DinB family protein [Thermomicrobiales bacterium]
MNNFATLARRMHAAQASWQAAVSDLTLEQVNHFERPGVLPIAFSLMHLVTTEDIRLSAVLIGGESHWASGGWEQRTGVNVPSVMRGTPMAVAESLRIGDLDAWRQYQTEVFARTNEVLLTTDQSRWNETYLETIPDAMRGGFLHLLCGEGQVSLGDYLEVVLYHHSLRHLGELEHARALVGLHGVGG